MPVESQVQPSSQTENLVTQAAAAADNLREKPRYFFLALLISFFASVIFSLIGFLLIAKINPDYLKVLTFLVFGWPIIIFGGYLVSILYYFKKNKDVFWGLIVSFLAFLILAVIVVKYY